MRGQRQGFCSTKPKNNEKPQGIQITLEEEKWNEKLQGEDTRDTKQIKNENDILIEVYNPKETMYTNQTGKLPHVSIQGNRYMMVLVHIGSDSIWVETMKNRTEGEMVLAIQRALKRMHAVGIIPKRQVLDNETSMTYRQEIMETGMTYQLVPPDDHRWNIAEKTIQTWKYHFISNCSGVSAPFPMHL